MKKLSVFLGLSLILFSVFGFAGLAGSGSLVMANMMVPGSMEEFADQYFSSFEGDNDSMYTGEGDDMLDFGGPNMSFATEANAKRLFTVTINNGLDTNETVVLLPGYTWKPGDSGNNWLVDGAIKTVADKTLSATGSPKTIKEFLSFIMRNPTNLAGIRISSNNSTTQIEQQIVKKELSPFKDLESEIINVNVYTNENAYKDKMVTVPTPNIVLGPETYLDFTIIANSVCTLTFFCGAVVSPSTTLRKKINKASSTFARVGIGNVQQLHAIRKANPTFLLRK